MKHNFRPLRLTAAVLLMLVFIIYACEKDEAPPNTAPVAAFTISPNSGSTQTNFLFDASTSSDNEDDKSVLVVRWDWQNDGVWDTDWTANMTENHTYPQEGNYNATMQVKDSGGLTASTSKNIVVTPASTGEKPVADFIASDTSITVGQSINFSDQSSNNPTSWQWDFGDENTSTVQNPSHAYDEAGTYTVSLSASNSVGSDSEVKQNFIIVSISGSAPIADFEANITTGNAPLNINFTDQSSNVPTNWEWDFGDGNTSSMQNPSHTYITEGTYTVSLTASNSIGSDSEVKEDYILTIPAGSAPIANYTANITDGFAPLIVEFTDLSENLPTSWEWDFDDGNTSTMQNPVHTFSSPGNYQVSMTATNAYGSDFHSKSNYILVTPGEACPGMPTFTYHGQTYNTVSIGGQCWMKENLNYETGNSWCYEDNPVICEYDGRLYDWQTAMGACPSGWHLPTYNDWDVLVDQVGGSSIAGGKLKKVGILSWNAPNTDATNESGFTALGGGYKSGGSFFLTRRYNGLWWTSTEANALEAWGWYMTSSSAEAGKLQYDKENRGFSVRCVMD